MAAPKIPSVAQFPKPHGRTMVELTSRVQAGPALAPSGENFTAGADRFGFALFDRQRKQITDAPGALYVARTPNSPVRGPFPVRWESLKVSGHYLSKTVATDPDAAKTLYVANLRFPKTGKWIVLGLFRLDNRLVGAPTAIKVLKTSAIPAVGDKAPKIHTPTVASVGGDVAKIDTRDPHDDMHDVDYASALGKRPIILLFATPALCQSRVCGPVVDIAEQVKHQRPSQNVAWIHMEVYKDNNLNKGLRPQLLAYHLQSEPWLFAINKKGRIAAVLEGAYSANELNHAVDAAVKG
ncbi:MAG: hypothetical protein ACJ76Z_15265 [Thermoleophilaceae bacterium]